MKLKHFPISNYISERTIKKIAHDVCKEYPMERVGDSAGYLDTNNHHEVYTDRSLVTDAIIHEFAWELSKTIMFTKSYDKEKTE